MTNVLMTMAGKSAFFDSPEFIYPKPLIEIQGKTMIEMAINNYKGISGDIRFIFVVNSRDCTKYHLDNVLGLLTDGKCEIIRINSETKGAACSALMAIDTINNDDTLIIANSDQVIEEDINKALKLFKKNTFDSAVITFSTVHPRWSYVKVDGNGMIIEAAEKRPISKKAIAGFYYFSKGKYFVEAAMRSIEKNASVDDVFYVAPTLNELILKGMRLGTYEIANAKYHTFYSPQKIEEYEKSHISK